MNKKDIVWEYTVMDDDGYTWYWDGSRIYVLNAEEEDLAEYDYIDLGSIHRAGYEAKTWKEALHWLVVDGYIPEEEAEWQTRPTTIEYKDWYLPDY